MLRQCRGRFPRHRLPRIPIVSDPDMHHGMCVTHVPWFISGSLTRGGGETFPAFPAHARPAILCIWQEAHGTSRYGADLTISAYFGFSTRTVNMMEPNHSLPLANLTHDNMACWTRQSSKWSIKCSRIFIDYRQCGEVYGSGVCSVLWDIFPGNIMILHDITHAIKWRCNSCSSLLLKCCQRSPAGKPLFQVFCENLMFLYSQKQHDHNLVVVRRATWKLKVC